LRRRTPTSRRARTFFASAPRAAPTARPSRRSSTSRTATPLTAGATFAICDAYCQDWYAACRDANAAARPGLVGLPDARRVLRGERAARRRCAVVVRDRAAASAARPSRTSCRDSYATGDGALRLERRARLPRDLFAGDTGVVHGPGGRHLPEPAARRRRPASHVAFPGVVPLVVDNRDGTYTVTYRATLRRPLQRQRHVQRAPRGGRARAAPGRRAPRPVRPRRACSAPPTGQTGRRAVFNGARQGPASATRSTRRRSACCARASPARTASARTPDVIDDVRRHVRRLVRAAEPEGTLHRRR
jgi:hypothetical protein